LKKPIGILLSSIPFNGGLPVLAGNLSMKSTFHLADIPSGPDITAFRIRGNAGFGTAKFKPILPQFK
jgi:hypothetical protein